MAAIIVTSLNSQFTRRIMGPSRATFRASQNLHEFCYSFYYYYYYYYYHYYNYYYYHHYLDYDKSWPKKDSRWGWNQKGGVIISGFPTEPYWDLPFSVGMLPKFPSGSFVAGMLPRLPPVSHQFPPLSFSRRVLSLRWGAGLLESLPHHWSTVWPIIFLVTR